MNTKQLGGFVLFITLTALLAGCGKTNPNANLASENADLKARVQKLEKQLQDSKNEAASPTAPAPASATNAEVQSQLDEAQKKAESAANELQSANTQVESLKAKVDQLTRQLSESQAAREKAEKALQLYQEKTGAVIKEFKTLRSTLGTTNAMLQDFHQKYLATQTTVSSAIKALPDSTIRRGIMGVWAVFTHADETWETADQQMQARSKEAQADYDKFVDFGGLGPNDYLIKMGKERILAPAEKDNAAAAAARDSQMVSFEKDLDLGIKNLQNLMTGTKA